jgi:hypothetical protein
MYGIMNSRNKTVTENSKGPIKSAYLLTNWLAFDKMASKYPTPSIPKWPLEVIRT